MGTVLFVCTANICRSPMAVGIFNALAEERGLPLRAESAGVAALVGDLAASHACQVAEPRVGMGDVPERGWPR